MHALSLFSRYTVRFRWHSRQCATNQLPWQFSTSRTKASGRNFSCTSCTAAKHRLVFLGTPEVAADVLDRLLNASNQEESTFQVAGVVSQPGRPKGRGRKNIAQPSPVESMAMRHGLSGDLIMCPVKANEPEFLERLTDWRPDLCLTAAYGNILPKKFLSIPRLGTLNIHPSLLPLYRGAAPVQRALQDGCKETGVSVAFTVRAMDAGPVLAQRVVPVPAEIQAPELLSQLFKLGTELLLENLPSVWSGDAAKKAVPQDESRVSHAAKMSKEEGLLDFHQPAFDLHNKVRAFAGWPGTTANFLLTASDGSSKEECVKIAKTQVVPSSVATEQSMPSVCIDNKKLIVSCGTDSASCLEILEVQPLGKKVMPAASFINGLNGRTLKLV